LSNGSFSKKPIGNRQSIKSPRRVGDRRGIQVLQGPQQIRVIRSRICPGFVGGNTATVALFPDFAPRLSPLARLQITNKLHRYMNDCCKYLASTLSQWC